MSEQGLEAIESTVQKTHEWLGTIAEVSHLSKGEAYKALRAVLHTLRDRLPVDAAVHFSAQLPLLVRGVFFEGWRPAEVPVKLSREEFLAAVNSKIVASRVIDPLRITRDVFGVLAAKLSPGETEKILQILPKDLQDLWSQSPDDATLPAG
jgi:uncharacterized protein (DUF2267 family)